MEIFFPTEPCQTWEETSPNITTKFSNKDETYTGCTKDFKTRCQAHLRSFENIKNKQTTLSSYVWSLKHASTPYTIRWSHRARGRPYNPSTGVCRLCLLEKYFILFEQDGASLNQRDEFFGHCFHKKPQLLMSKKWCIVTMNHPCTFWKWFWFHFGTVHVICRYNFCKSSSAPDDCPVSTGQETL